MKNRACVVAVAFGILACKGEGTTAEVTPSAPPSAGAPVSSSATAPSPAESAAPKPALAELIPKVIRAQVEAWNAHDPAKVAAVFETGAKLLTPTLTESLGRDAITAYVRAELGGFPDLHLTATRVFVKDHAAVWEWVLTGKNAGAAPGQKNPTGRTIGVGGVSVGTFDDEGLIREEHLYYDAPTMDSQLDPKSKAGTFRPPASAPSAPIEVHAAKGTPDEAKTIEQGNALINTFEGKNESAYMATVAPDYVLEDFTTPGPQDPAALKKSMALENKAFPDWKLARPFTMGVDGYFVAEVALEATYQGKDMPKAKGKHVTVRGVDIQRIQDGKLSREWEYADSAEMSVSLGLVPAPTPAPPPSASSTATAH
jgi:uncharacterized protein (TIGR02246 family)